MSYAVMMIRRMRKRDFYNEISFPTLRAAPNGILLGIVRFPLQAAHEQTLRRVLSRFVVVVVVFSFESCVLSLFVFCTYVEVTIKYAAMQSHKMRLMYVWRRQEKYGLFWWAS